MKNPALAFVLGPLCACALAAGARADSLTNNFTATFDYVANGIVGEPNWDGVYLGFGDIAGGNAGGSGNGASLQANTLLQAGPFGYLTVQTVGSDWSGSGDDGFYAWKLVSGDFDVSVESAPPWQNQGNNFGGLLVRAWNTNQSGAPVSFTSTNAAENWLALFRAQQFGIGEIRQATNGVNFENTFPENSSDTNSSRFYRITRVGDTFSFYVKTNTTDDWFLITNAATGGGYVRSAGSITRADWHNQPVQVGIAQAIFARPTTPAVDYFTDFELSGPNVTPPPATLPAAPDSLVTSSPNPDGSLTLSWNTNGGTGSIVIVRKITPANNVLVVNPVQGLTYTADTNFPDPGTLIAGGTHVVYIGAGTNVTVSGLGGSNNVYEAEVLSYDNSGASIVYNTAAPATNLFLGSGVPSSIALTVTPTSIPLNGVGLVQIIATFTTGDQVDVTKDPSVTLTSSDPATIAVNSGVLNGLQLGSATITATYASFSTQTNVAVVTPRFADDFSISQDYLTNGLPGSTWDGIFDRPGDMPGANNNGTTIATTAVDANISAPNTLTVNAGGTDWVGPSDDGFLLFKKVPGDFQAVVHVASIPRITNTNSAAYGDGSVPYMFVGLMARAANADGSAYNGSENWVYWSEFDQFGDSTEARFALNGVDTERPIFDSQTKTNYWLLMQRVASTNFYFYRKVSASDPWTPEPDVTIVRPDLNGVPLEVGPFQSTYTGVAGTVQFDSFMLDADGLVASPPVIPPQPATNFVMTLNPDITMTLSWDVPGTNADGTAIRSLVVMRAGAPVSVQPNLAFGFAGDPAFGDPAQDAGSGNYVVFRSAFGDTNTHQQVTITGLSPGVEYYAAIYTFVGLGATRTFNTASEATATGTPRTSLVDGNLLGLQSTLAQNGIPLGGVGIPIVNGIFTGGALVDITPAVAVTSDDTNIVVTTNSTITGLALGSTTVHVTYAGFTNVLAVTVRNPTFADNFGTSHDYLANGVTNTAWDGVYLQPGNIPDTTFVSDPAAATLTADANISASNVLTVENINEGFEFAQDDGFFLFKYVPGDFQMAVDLLNYTNNGTQPYNNSGLLARGYTMATNGLLGAPMDESGNENWISWTRFDEFGIGTRYERCLDNAISRPANPDQNGPDRWMLMARVHGTNFYFFQRSDTNSPWHATGIGHLIGPNAVGKFAGQPMQVGLELSGFDSGTPVSVGFANFMLDVASPALGIASLNTNIIVMWPGSPGAQLEGTPELTNPNWQPMGAPPVFVNGLYELSLPLDETNHFFRLRN